MAPRVGISFSLLLSKLFQYQHLTIIFIIVFIWKDIEWLDWLVCGEDTSISPHLQVCPDQILISSSSSSPSSCSCSSSPPSMFWSNFYVFIFIFIFILPLLYHLQNFSLLAFVFSTVSLKSRPVAASSLSSVQPQTLQLEASLASNSNSPTT